MEKYVKVLLYGYPLLKTVSEDYEEHIKNKALLSFDSRWNTERLAEYLAEEIVKKRKLEWLKGRMEKVFERLDDTERALLRIRYFGEKKKTSALLLLSDEKNGERKPWSERKYYRRQIGLLQKICKLFERVGLTQTVYFTQFAKIQSFAKIYRYVEEGRDRRAAANEWKG